MLTTAVRACVTMCRAWLRVRRADGLACGVVATCRCECQHTTKSASRIAAEFIAASRRQATSTSAICTLRERLARVRS